MTNSLVDGYVPRQEWSSYLEDPGTWDVSREAKGRYANILLDDWFKRAFGSENRKRLLQLLLQELIPERKINQLKYVPQEYTNLFPGMYSGRYPFSVPVIPVHFLGVKTDYLLRS